jgi:alkanesulfonate monooxygenase SsuD/methylene tetrahydromethanopterin reductase-like flavin-dependent oxidoreductase (luciferase family)
VLWPTAPWPEAAAAFRRAEELGFAHAWLYDHLVWRELEPWYECYTRLAAAAAITSRIELGPLVTTPNFRHPVPTAKALLALDELSGGRICAGLGAGSTSNDAAALGTAPLSARERIERFADWLELLDRLLSEPETTYQGPYYSATRAAVGGSMQRHPRLAVAATGPRGLALVARFADRWIAQDHPIQAETGYESVRLQSERLDAACREHGRDQHTPDRLLLLGNGDEQPLESIDAFDECVERYAELGFTGIVVHWPRDEPPHNTDPRVLEAIAARYCG